LRLGCLGLLVGLGMLSGCLSFRSIAATASVGQLIAPRAAAVSLLPLFCESENILSSTGHAAGQPSAPSCPQADVERASREIIRSSQHVSAYATLLRGVAEFDDNRIGDPLERVVRGVDVWVGPEGAFPTLPSAQGLATAAGAIASLMVSRVAILSESTKYQAETDIALRRRMLDELEREAGGGEATQAAVARLERQTMRLGLLHFQHFARRANEALLEYKKALVSAGASSPV
jgi:hypothetical protein